MGNEELLLPIQREAVPSPYPTALIPPPSGLVTHMEVGDDYYQNYYNPPQRQEHNIPSITPFHPTNFLSVPVNKKLVGVLTENRRSRPSTSTPRVLSELAPPGINLYEATYSGIDVYELVVNGHSLMRRRDDSWVNATHILKVLSTN